MRCGRHRLATPHGARCALGNPEEEARPHPRFGQRGTRPGLPRRRAGKRMTPPTHDPSARQSSGEPSPVPRRDGERNNRPGKPDAAHADGEIAGLPSRSTQDLRLGWRKLHRSGPPLGLSRDLMIRALANELQEYAQGGPSAALRRRLQAMARELARGDSSFDPSTMPKTGTTLVRQWRGHIHTVLVHEDGFEYEGQHYRSLTVIAERITETHWSGPRFFGLTKRTGASVG